MSTYVNMPDGPAPIANIGIQLKALATEFGQQATAIESEIASIDGSAPWGKDETGTTFAASYHQVPAGSQTGSGFSTSLHEELKTAGDPLGKIADNIVGTVANYQIIDADSANAIDHV